MENIWNNFSLYPKLGTGKTGFEQVKNYERICLNKYNFFLNLAFWQVGEKN